MFLRIVTAVLSLSTVVSFGLYASNTATATVNYSVGSVNAISVSGNPGALNITTAVAGSALTNAADATTTYSLTTNNSNKTIVGALSSNLESGLTLTANLTAPTGATSAGAVSLSTTSANLVTGITQLNATGLAITYTLSATLAAAQVSTNTTVTYTIQ